ncbi:hypothetical protein Hanom_Chr14g01303651 [Helianthus anomalus]
MCYRVVCKSCGKFGWGGCGEHVKLVYGGIEKGKHCMCRSWPGVVVSSSETASATASVAAATATSTAG